MDMPLSLASEYQRESYSVAFQAAVAWRSVYLAESMREMAPLQLSGNANSLRWSIASPRRAVLQLLGSGIDSPALQSV